jgi:hypothetical protein
MSSALATKSLQGLEEEIRGQNAQKAKKVEAFVQRAQSGIVDPIINKIQKEWGLTLKITGSRGSNNSYENFDAEFDVKTPKSTLHFEISKHFGYGDNHFFVRIESPLPKNDTLYVSGGGPGYNGNKGTAREVVERALTDIVTAKVNGTLHL